MSIDSSGNQANSLSQDPSISADGRFVAFYSPATNLVAGDTNDVEDVFVRDRTTGITEQVSVNSAGVQANAYSAGASISADGRFITFYSSASNLVVGDTNGFVDVFLHDRQTNTTERVSVDSAGNQANEGSGDEPSISADGRFVAFFSYATNLVVGDTNGWNDVFVHDRTTGITERVSIDSSGNQANSLSQDPSISADGRFVAFYSPATNLVAGDTNDVEDVFVRDRTTGITERVSVNSAGLQANAYTAGASISANGDLVAFHSWATNLVPGDTNLTEDVFVRDRDPLLNDLLVNFGSAGLWQRMNNSGWLKINRASPVAIAAGDLDGNGKDEVIASYGSGLWARYNATWVKLHNAVPNRFIAGNLDANSKDEVIGSYGSGLWALYNSSNWFQLASLTTTQDLAIGDFDGNGNNDLVIDYGAHGLWALYNNSVATPLHTLSPLYIATGDLDGDGKDELIADFGGASDLWVRYNNATWVKLHVWPTQGLATGDLDGSGKDELLVDFGASGLWVRYNNANWSKLHASSPTNMITADLDSNGKDDAVIDFGSSGLWARYNNATWRRLHTAPRQALAAGAFD